MKASTKQWLEFAAVEKAFKALIEEKGIRMSRIHNLTRLFALTESFLISPIDETELEMLDNVYTSSRYPGGIGLLSTGKPSIKESNELYTIAKRIYDILFLSIESENK